ncbi:MAG: hypothetical protein RI894_1396 [Bacteroidota bacterium]|jgi:hypothetical protein
MKNFILLITLILFSGSIATAQPKEKAKKQVIDFSKSGGKTTVKTNEEESKNGLEYKNAIWIEATSFLAGYVDFGYERAITNNFNLEVAVGPSYKGLANFISDAIGFEVLKSNINENTTYWTDKGYIPGDGVHLRSFSSSGYYNNLKENGGIYLLAEPKYFPEDDAFDGFFVAGRFQYISNNYSTLLPDIVKSKLSSGGQIIYGTEKITLVRTNFDIIPSIGWEWQTGRVLFDFEGGMGLRFASIKGYDTGYGVDASGNYHFEMLNPYIESAMLPTFSAAFKLGFNF